MARQDFRNRNTRKVTETRQEVATYDEWSGVKPGYTKIGYKIKGGTTINGQRYTHYNPKDQRYYRVDGMTERSKRAYAAYNRRVDNMQDTPGTPNRVSKRFLGYNLASVKVGTRLKVNRTIAPTDQRHALKDGDSDSQALQAKRDGRDSLRIRLQADQSTNRLTGGLTGGRTPNRLRVDVQGGGGRSGLNIPR